jgi:hypothetical protein
VIFGSFTTESLFNCWPVSIFTEIIMCAPQSWHSLIVRCSFKLDYGYKSTLLCNFLLLGAYFMHLDGVFVSLMEFLFTYIKKLHYCFSMVIHHCCSLLMHGFVQNLLVGWIKLNRVPSKSQVLWTQIAVKMVKMVSLRVRKEIILLIRSSF